MKPRNIPTLLVTGGAGFIGSNFVLEWLLAGKGRIVNLDLLTYAGNLRNLASIGENPDHTFVRGDLCDPSVAERVLREFQPDAVIHFAAESHVDRSIHAPAGFIQTNIVGTFELLRTSLEYWRSLKESRREGFAFVHVSTDEVFGSLSATDARFHEDSPYRPNSPYSASKAAADHLVRAYHHTYGLPVITTNCSNNYGRFQFPEKLIPLIILNAIAGKPLPVYGDGLNVRDWLYVTDHCEALRIVLENGTAGETYMVGGNSEKANIEVVRTICGVLDRLKPLADGRKHESLITSVKDRPGHDRRYAVDASKIRRELGWSPRTAFSEGIEKTVQWYLEHSDWVAAVTSGEYRKWIDLHYSASGVAREGI